MATESSLVRVFRGRIDDAKERHELSLRLPVADAEYLANELAELEAKLAALDWTPITESNLPRSGDHIARWREGFICASMFLDRWNGKSFPSINETMTYTHRRPINPPVQP